MSDCASLTRVKDASIEWVTLFLQIAELRVGNGCFLGRGRRKLDAYAIAGGYGDISLLVMKFHLPIQFAN